MSRKYELIKDGNRNRLRALRTWQVAGRTVNHGDLGGYVYDENTLSQDGGCWIFSGAYENPLIRVYGDAIVDMNGDNTASTGAFPVPGVNIGGTTEIIGAHRFQSDNATSTYTFAPSDFEQGDLNTSVGISYDNGKISSPNAIRSTLIKVNTGTTTFNVTNTAFDYAFVSYDRNKVVLSATGWKTGVAGGTTAVGSPDTVYIAARVRKTPTAATTPADATAAALSALLPIDSTINIINSRIVFNYTVTPNPSIVSSITIKPNSQTAAYVNTTNIVNCDFTLNAPGNAVRTLYLFGDFDNVQGTMTSAGVTSTVVGIWRNVKNLVVTGNIAWTRISAFFRNVMQVQDCDNFYFDAAVFPTDLINEIGSAGYPVTFTRCNVPNGLFYHHPQIRNTYVDVDFSLAESELNKNVGGNNLYPLVSSEVNGMYRAYATKKKTMCALVECLESVSTWTPSNIENSYNTTIYRDAYINGRFSFAGNNVLGGSYGHDREVINDVTRAALKGKMFNNLTIGQTISGIIDNANFWCAPEPYRINGYSGFAIKGLTDSGLRAYVYSTDANGKILTATSYTADTGTLVIGQLMGHKVYIAIAKSTGGAPDSIDGITITTYKGCKLFNTLPSDAVATIEGNNRIQDDAALYNTNINGTGFLGGNAVIGTQDKANPVNIVGYVYADNDAKFFPHTFTATSKLSMLDIRDNAELIGDIQNFNLMVKMRDNANIGVKLYPGYLFFDMSGNSRISSPVSSSAIGKLTMKDDAVLSSGALNSIGDITLCGKFKLTASKTFTGKRVLDSQDAPTYDDNVHTRYDF